MIATFAPYLEDHALDAIGLERDELESLRSLVDAGRLDEAAAAVTPAMFGLGLTGAPDEVTERIVALGEAGVTHVRLGGPLGPDPRAAMRLLGERILPALRG
jgi:5,10-methylenetetrahydromethanopterin reductase